MLMCSANRLPVRKSRFIEVVLPDFLTREQFNRRQSSWQDKLVIKCQQNAARYRINRQGDLVAFCPQRVGKGSTTSHAAVHTLDR